MYEISDVKRKIESLRGEIYIQIDKSETKNLCEILKLSKELDELINIWNIIILKYCL